MDNIIKVKTKTKETFRSKSTGKTYATKEEFLQQHALEDLAQDLTVTIDPKGLEVLSAAMKKK